MMSTDSYFDFTEICPQSLEIVEHSKITTVRCGKCKKLNPNFHPLYSTPPIQKLNRTDQKIHPTKAPQAVELQSIGP